MKISKKSIGMNSSIINSLPITYFFIKKVYIFFIFLFFFILFFSSETSNDTSFALTRTALHSIYLFKFFGIQASDFVVILGSTIIILFCLLQQKLIVINKNLYIYLIIFFIPFVGGCFSFVNDKLILKYVLYDVKLLIYFFFGYLLSTEIMKYSSTSHYHILITIFVLWILGACLDSLIVNLFYTSEYPSLLGIPAFSGMIPVYLLFSILIRKKISLLYLFSIITFHILLFVSMVRLSGIYWLFASLFLIYIYEVSLKLKGIYPYFLFLFGFIFSSIFLYLFLIFYSADLVNFKSDGFTIRQFEIHNFFLNNNFFTYLFGNGWGAGWKEIVFIELGNVYSRGNNVEDYNFVWHNVLGAFFYKQGIIYFLIIIFFIYNLARKINIINLNNIQNNKSIFSIKMDWILILILPSILTPGILKEAIFLGFVFSFYQQEFNLKTQNSF